MAEVSLHLAAEETLEDCDDGQEDEQCEEDDDADDDKERLVVVDDDRTGCSGQEEGIEELTHPVEERRRGARILTVLVSLLEVKRVFSLTELSRVV